MKFSTARGLAIILGVVATVSITTYFYLDEKDMMIPFLALIIKPLMMVTLFPTVFLLLASILATSKNEEKITRHNFLNAFVILICLIAFRTFVTFMR
ncbi:hypothetical protein [Sporosarcina sp. OR05]|uniref:hypothetical protein n=1 Tax=Sporosarcina sp. OR05 TaxID=2969819 RepID=UPI00352AD86A